MRRRAFFIALEFPVALPYHAPILIRAVPDLGAVNAAAIPADDLTGEGAAAVPLPGIRLALLHLLLHLIPGSRLYDGRMAVPNIILGDLAFVHLHFLGQKIGGELLLKASVPLVFFIGQDAFDHAVLPFLLSARCRDPFIRQRPCDPADSHPFDEHPVDPTHQLGFFRHDLRQAI